MDLTSESRSPPRLVLVEHGDEASATGDWEAYILADNVAVRCRKGSLQSVVTDLLAVYYAWDLTFPTQYQLLGFLQMYLLNDVTEAKAFKKSKRFLKVEQQYLAI